MRHRRKGRQLGRNSSHRKAMLKNLASSLFLTERDAEFDENEPKVKGRVITTLHKAKEVRPLVERCITIAKRSLPHKEAAQEFATTAERGSSSWQEWRESDQWRQWAEKMAPAVVARRRVLTMLGDKQAVRILFDEVAPRFVDRLGGYTRIMRLANPRLGDAGVQAILEFVGENDRVRKTSSKPAFEVDDDVTPGIDEAVESDAGSEAQQVADQEPADVVDSDENATKDDFKKSDD